VATNVGGVAEVVGPDTGVLVAAGDEAAMGQALAGLSRDPALRSRMGAAGCARVLERYSAERLVSDVERLYAELLATPAVSRG
jgi:glycosyltransferase involved in cell wall biosynthesis